MNKLRVATGIAAVLTVALFALQLGAAEVARWSLEEGSGTSTAEPVGGFDGTLTNGPTWSSDAAPVPSGSSFSVAFDGTDDFINTSFGGIGGTADRTVSFWVKTTDVGNGIVAWGDDTQNGAKWHIRPNNDGSDGRVVGAVRTEVQGGNQTGVSDIADGQWHHVVSVFSGNDNDDVVHWVDGRRELSSFVDSQTVNTDNSATGDAQPVNIGRRIQAGGADNVNGRIDEVRVFDDALSAAEVRQLFNGTTVPQAALKYDGGNAPVANEWLETHQLIESGSFDWQLGGGVTHNAGPNTLREGITGAYQFDGSGTATADLGSTDFQDDFPGDATDNSASFEVWFRPSDLSGREVLIEAGGSGDGTSLTLDGSNVLFTVKNAGIDAQLSGNVSGVTDDFVQAVGVIDFENGASDLSLFINGELLDEAVNTSIADWAGTNEVGLGSIAGSSLGADGGSFDFTGIANFDGEIGLTNFFTEALTVDDVRALFDSVAPPIPEPASMAIWSLLGLALAGFGYYRFQRKN